jgi:multiple sugar transport system ATP-binding protein
LIFAGRRIRLKIHYKGVIFMARVLLKDVKKVYDNGFQAVKGASLDIADKEFMVIVGPSGCGKTTTLRMIAGLEEISSGTIAIGEKIVNDVPPKDRDIAMVFQNYALYPHMTVFQNIAFGLKLRKYPKDEIKKRVEEVAQMLDITGQLDKKPKALSGGQRQRVALGRAIVRNPAAFLFDEPLSNLDAKLRVTTRAELKSLHRRLNTTSIYVTHDQAEAMTLGDRICVMFDGEIQQVAPPMEVYDKPANRFVAGFLGTPPMNFLKGKIVSKGGKIAFVLTDGDVIELKTAGSRFSNYADKEMVLGIRPEHLTVEPLTGQTNNGIKSKVNIVEPLGDRKDVYLTTVAGQKFIANLDPHTSLDVDHQVVMYVDTNKAHIFEPGETGKNISLC